MVSEPLMMIELSLQFRRAIGASRHRHQRKQQSQFNLTCHVFEDDLF
jgi:hypothetical protein